MQTLYLSAEDPKTAATAANIIMQGGLVAIPTETVYGLGANGLDENAVAKIFEAKGRPQDNPLILHIAGPEQIELFCHHIPQAAYDLAEKFWPGPLTMVLPARSSVPKRTTGGLSTVAVRCPDSDVTREIIRLSGVPLAAPSANISGKPSTTTAEHVRHDHDGRIELIVDGGSCRVGVESTIVDLTEQRPRLLRPGGITPEQLMAVLGDLVSHLTQGKVLQMGMGQGVDSGFMTGIEGGHIFGGDPVALADDAAVEIEGAFQTVLVQHFNHGPILPDTIVVAESQGFGFETGITDKCFSKHGKFSFRFFLF